MTSEFLLRGLPLGERSTGLWVPKGWGGEHWIVNDEEHDYCAKRLFVAAGKQFSYHYHPIKHETFYVISGAGLLYYANPEDSERERRHVAHAKQRPLVPGDILTITPGTVHRVRADEDLWIFEASTFHREEDSIRVEKGD